MLAHAWPEARDHSAWMRATVAEKAVVSKGCDHRQKEIVVRVVAAVGIEVRRKNADDGPARAVEIDRPAHDLRIGIEESPPELIANHQDMCGARLVFLFGKEPADLRLHAQGWKKLAVT